MYEQLPDGQRPWVATFGIIRIKQKEKKNVYSYSPSTAYIEKKALLLFFSSLVRILSIDDNTNKRNNVNESIENIND